jgi:hypothetical protein
MNIINFIMMFNYMILVSKIVKDTQDKQKNIKKKLKIN